MERATVMLTGALCTTARLPPHLSCTEPFERTHHLQINRPGVMTVDADFAYIGDYSPNELRLEVRCGDVLVAERKLGRQGSHGRAWVIPPGQVGAFDVALPQPCMYELRLFNFMADTKGGHQTTYRLDVKHP